MEMLADSAPMPGSPAFAALFNRVEDAIIVGDVATGRIVFINHAAEGLLGYPARDAYGLPIETLAAETLRPHVRQAIADYATNGRGDLSTSGPRLDLTAVRNDGEEITVELTLSALPDPGGDARYVLAIARDVTPRSRVEAEHRALLVAARDYAGRLEELATMQAGFTAMVAHELGTPIAAIRGLADLLLSHPLPADQQSSIIEAIRSEVVLLQRLVTDVQAASAIERDEFPVHLRPVSVVSLMADATAYAKTLPKSHPITVDADDTVITAMVQADPERIGQVLRNLLVNAARHTPSGTPIALRARRAPGAIRIEVADGGPGISPTDLARIFEKYGRGADALDRQTPGAGLGLYLSRRIIWSHGSDLTVTSSPGQETTFAFRLETV
jgi:PAS domain S-box-containing protein